MPVLRMAVDAHRHHGADDLVFENDVQGVDDAGNVLMTSC